MNLYYNTDSDRYTENNPYVGHTEGINEQVKAIVAVRSKNEALLSASRKSLKSIEPAIQNYKAVKKSAFGTIDMTAEYFNNDKAKAQAFLDALGRVDESSLDAVTKKCSKISESIQAASKRFKRKNVSIAIVGESRQGKSTLIQKITGLENDAVPTAVGGICTAARSRIINGHDKRAKVTFYDQNEFLHDVIAPYLVNAGVMKEEERYTLNSFADADELYARINTQNADVYIQRLGDYLRKRSYYEEYLGEGTVEFDDFLKLREYMAQRDQINTEFSECRYYAVKDVEIVAPFAHGSDVSNLMIYDTIGISEPTLNVKQKMFETISEEADIVLYVSRLTPDSNGWIKEGNLRLYYDMIERLKQIPAYRWIFWVLNHEDEANYNPNLGGLAGTFQSNVDFILNNIGAQMSPNRSRFKPAGLLCVDCRSEEDVAENIVRPLLYHLSANLSAIDSTLVEDINQKITELENLLAALKPKLQGLMLPARDNNAIKNVMVFDAINSMAQRINAAIPDFIVKHCPAAQGAQWRADLIDVINNLGKKIPNEDRIRQINIDSFNKALTTIDQAYMETRNRLNTAFDGDKFQFDDTISNMKKDLMRLFMESSALINVCPAFDYDDPNIVKVISDVLFAKYKPYNDCLVNIFKSVADFNLSQGSALTNWISGMTKKLDTNLGNGNIPLRWDTCGIEKAIITRLDDIVAEIRNDLLAGIGSLSSPVEQIRNCILSFQQAISDNGGTNMVAWQNVFDPFVEEMYPDAFKESNAYNARVKNWNESVNQLVKAEEITTITL